MNDRGSGKVVKLALRLGRFRNAHSVCVGRKRVRNLVASPQHVKEQIAALVAVCADLKSGGQEWQSHKNWCGNDRVDVNQHIILPWAKTEQNYIFVSCFRVW